MILPANQFKGFTLQKVDLEKIVQLFQVVHNAFKSFFDDGKGGQS